MEECTFYKRKKSLLMVIAVLIISIIHADVSVERPMVVVIPSYNNKDVCIKNLNSIFSQDYNNFFVIYVDDASSDGTAGIVEQYIKEHTLENKILLIKNSERIGSLANLYQAIHLCNPNMIIIDVDGDDWLINNQVLKKINNIYSDPDVWVTYGQFVYYPSGDAGWAAQVPEEIIHANEFRDWNWTTTALRTFYAGLFQNIDKQDLLCEGKFYIMAGDLAFMFCVLEQAHVHSRFIPEILYIYNTTSSINDDKVDRELQFSLGLETRNGRRYQPVKEPYEGHYKAFLKQIQETQRHTPKAFKKIYITPGYWGELFSVNNPVFNRDDCLKPVYQLREECAKVGCQIVQADNLNKLHDADNIIVFEVFPDQIEQLKQYPKEKLILFLWEPPTVLPDNYNTDYHKYFSRIYTFRDDLVDNKTYFKLHYAVMHPMIENVVVFDNKRLCTSISANKSSFHDNELYGERRKIIDFFEMQFSNDFDFYGKLWPKGRYKNYKGEVDRKVDVMKNYKFCICYENIKGIPGYVTEKIFDCFWAGCVPVYYGAPNITEYVPRNCFVAREDFADESELYEYMKNMSKAEYERYIRNIKKYLESSLAQSFSIANFIKTVMHEIIPLDCIPQVFK